MKSVKEMSDREIQEAILLNLRKVRTSSHSTNGWIQFLGIIQIIGIIATVLFLLNN